jgi:hypothetical protein
VNPAEILIYHITDVSNLPGILAEGGLHSDAVMAGKNPSLVIGYDHIKLRRLKEITVPCCGDRFVGEFVPFYFCPRAPMLLAVNNGRSGRPPGCQQTIVHLVSSLAAALATKRVWAVSSGNAGAYHTTFDNQLSAVTTLDWSAIRATQWAGRQHQKSAELLVANFFPVTALHMIGCHNSEVAERVRGMLSKQAHQSEVRVQLGWYY